MTKPRVKPNTEPAKHPVEPAYTLTEDELRRLVCARWGNVDNDAPLLEGLAFASADELRVVSEHFVQAVASGQEPISELETALLRIADRLEAAARLIQRARRRRGEDEPEVPPQTETAHADMRIRDTLDAASTAREHLVEALSILGGEGDPLLDLCSSLASLDTVIRELPRLHESEVSNG